MPGRLLLIVTVGVAVLAGLGFLLLGGRTEGEDRMRPSARALEWLPSETAPLNRPVYLLHGDFILPDGTRIPIPGDRIAGAGAGWGGLGSTHIVEPLVKPLPVAVEATWYALTEGTGYQGRADLPVEDMATLFATPVPHPLDGSPEAPDRLLLGMAPGGDMAVWAAGVNATVALGIYPAEPVALGARELFGTDDTPLEEVVQILLEEQLAPPDRAALAETGPQPGLWREMDRRFPWAPSMADAQAIAFQLNALNGEVEWMDAAPSNAARAAPRVMNVYWQAAEGGRVAEVSFDPEETRAAFAGFGEGRALQLVFEPAPAGTSVDVVLTDGTLSRRFESSRVEIYAFR